MYKILGVEDNNYDEVVAFLQNVKAIAEIDEEILRNALIIYEESKVIGAISFEAFNMYALIRYFVFRRNVDEQLVKDLVEELGKKCKSEGMTHLFSIVNNEDLENLFITFDFQKVNIKDVYIDELAYYNTEFKHADLLIKAL